MAANGSSLRIGNFLAINIQFKVRCGYTGIKLFLLIIVVSSEVAAHESCVRIMVLPNGKKVWKF